jgi:hypothetical protein
VREYGRVHSAFWSSADIQTLSDDGKVLALYLLTCTHGTIAGVFRMPDGYVSEDLKWTNERVCEGFAELFKNGFANRCETTKWVWIRKFLEWNPAENPNQWKAVWKVAAQIPGQCCWRADFIEFLSKLTGQTPPSGSNPSGTVTEPFRNHISSQHTPTPNPTHTQHTPTISSAAPPRRRASSRETSADEDPGWLLEFKLAYPNRAGDQGWRKTVRAAHARIAQGHTTAEFIAGAKRYCAFCDASGKTGTEFVKQACTFLGPDKHFLAPWDPAPTKAEQRLNANIDGAREWLAQSGEST